MFFLDSFILEGKKFLISKLISGTFEVGFIFWEMNTYEIFMLISKSFFETNVFGENICDSFEVSL